MPIEIKELVIKTTIDNGGSSLNNNDRGDLSETLNEIKTKLIDECVFQIMEQLGKNNER